MSSGEHAAAPPGRWVAARVRATGVGLHLFVRGMALVAAGAPRAVAAYLVLILVLSLLPVLQVWLGKVVVDALAGRGAGGDALSGVMTAGVWYAVTLAAVAGLEPVRDMLSTWLRDHGVAEIDRRLMAAGERLVDLGRIERPAFGDELRLIEDVVAQAPSLFRFLQNGLGAVVTLAGLLLLLGRLHPVIPIALVALSVPHVRLAQRASLLRYRAMIQRSRAAREMDYCARIITEPAAAKEIRVFGLGGFFLGRFRAHFAAALAEVTALRVRELRLAAAFAALHAGALAGGFWYVAAQAGAGRLGLGEVALYLGAVAQAEARLLFLSTAFGTAHQVVLQLPRLFAFLDAAGPVIRVGAAGLPTPAVVRTGLALRDVRFSYPESDAPVLAGVTADLPAGKVTALVGANGAGKSTLVKLLTRMYDATAGECLLDGAPLHAYDLDALRRRTSVVYQDFARFSLTLRENIAVGGVAAVTSSCASASSAHPGAADGPGVGTPDALSVEEAARRAGADEVARRLPRGYDTPLTRRFAGGTELSGGEWQAVALARSYIRDEALVILDEPTAALDADAEERLFEQFRELAAGKTALLVSHRFSTVKMADRIVVLEHGRVVEEGSHTELIAKGGVYAELFEKQAARYR